MDDVQIINHKIIQQNDDLISQTVSLKSQLKQSQFAQSKTDDSYYKQQIDILESKIEVLNKKVQNQEHSLNNQEVRDIQSMDSAKQLYSRYEDTNAALERAFERISALEADNNRYVRVYSIEIFCNTVIMSIG